jgi:hypothetical protein
VKGKRARSLQGRSFIQDGDSRTGCRRWLSCPAAGCGSHIMQAAPFSVARGRHQAQVLRTSEDCTCHEKFHRSIVPSERHGLHSLHGILVLMRDMLQESLVDTNWAEIADHIETIEELYEVCNVTTYPFLIKLLLLAFLLACVYMLYCKTASVQIQKSTCMFLSDICSGAG